MTPSQAPGSGANLTPVPGTTVKLIYLDEPGHELTTSTNEHGFYQFHSLPFGPFKVMVQKPDMSFFPLQQHILLGPQNQRERATFIGFPQQPAGGGEGPPPGGGDPV
jgi:hypothetical protein